LAAKKFAAAQEAARKKAEQQATKQAAAQATAAKKLAAAQATAQKKEEQRVAALTAKQTTAAAKQAAQETTYQARLAATRIAAISPADAYRLNQAGAQWVPPPTNIGAVPRNVGFLQTADATVYRVNDMLGVAKVEAQAKLDAAKKYAAGLVNTPAGAAQAQRVADIMGVANAAVAQGAPVGAAVSSAFAADAQQYPQPLVQPTSPEMAPIVAGGLMTAAGTPSMLAQEPTGYGPSAWETLQPQPSADEAAGGELVDEWSPADVETQAAAGAVEEAQAAEEEPEPPAYEMVVRDETRAPSRPRTRRPEYQAPPAEEQPTEEGYQVVSPEEEQAIYEQSQAEQVTTARGQARTGRGGGYEGGFFGLGAVAQAKVVARRAAAKAVQKGVPPAHAAAVGQRVARQYMADAGWAVARPGQGRGASAWADPSF
jgi:hypothetical protein